MQEDIHPQENNQEITSINLATAVATSLNYRVDESKRKQLVCVHYMRSRCTRGDKCDYLHQWDESKIPICRFYQQTGTCNREADCVYRHPKGEEGGMGAAKK